MSDAMGDAIREALTSFAVEHGRYPSEPELRAFAAAVSATSTEREVAATREPTAAPEPDRVPRSVGAAVSPTPEEAARFCPGCGHVDWPENCPTGCVVRPWVAALRDARRERDQARDALADARKDASLALVGVPDWAHPRFDSKTADKLASATVLMLAMAGDDDPGDVASARAALGGAAEETE